MPPYGRSKKGVDGNLNPLPDPSSRISIGTCEVLDDQRPQKTYAKASDDKATTNTSTTDQGADDKVDGARAAIAAGTVADEIDKATVATVAADNEKGLQDASLATKHPSMETLYSVRTVYLPSPELNCLRHALDQGLGPRLMMRRKKGW